MVEFNGCGKMIVYKYDELPEIAGIYRIWNTMNGKNYVGQTNNLRIRQQHHFTDLRCGVHHNTHLQNAWNKYGEDEFEFEILQICPISELDDAEKYWINYYDSTNREYGYNFEKGGHYNTWSNETRKKIMAQVELRRQKILNERISTVENLGGVKWLISQIREGKTRKDISRKTNIPQTFFNQYLKLLGTTWGELYQEQLGFIKFEEITTCGGLPFIIKHVLYGDSKSRICSELKTSPKSLNKYLDSFGLNNLFEWYTQNTKNNQIKFYYDHIERFGGKNYFNKNIGILSLKEMAEEMRLPQFAIKSYMDFKHIKLRG